MSTFDDRLARRMRGLLGLLFVMTGVMKIVVPELAEAWSGQLLAAQLPLYEVNVRLVPLVEIAVGTVLLVGLYTRLASLVVIGIMFVATYVHFTVNDPALFPLQPSEPVIPIVVIVMSAYLVWKGGGGSGRERQPTSP